MGERFGTMPPKSLLVQPKRKLCPPPPPSEDCAPKQLTGSVLLECNSRPETPKMLVITPELVSKNCFFVDFATKTVCCCGFTPEFIKVRVVFETMTFYFYFYFLFFWSSPQISSNFAMNIFFLVHTFEFKDINFSCPHKICLCLPSHAILAPGLMKSLIFLRSDLNYSL